MSSQNPVLSLVFGVHLAVASAHVSVDQVAAGSAQSFFVDALPYAQQASAATKVEVAVILAQWADEQGYQWPPMYNNPGNVGDPGAAGQTSYSTVEAGVEAYISTMLLPYYSGVRASIGDTAQCYALGQSPWAGGHYDQDGGPPGEDLIKIIAEFNLSQYNTGPTPAPVPPPAPVIPPQILKKLIGPEGTLNAPIVAGFASASGYTLAGADGGTFNYDAPFYGSLANIKLNAPIIDAVPTRAGNGLYMVATDGGVFALGDAAFFGSAGSMKLNAPVVGMDTTKSGNGYWLFAADGGVFSYGDAPFLGSPACLC
jgi:hypothetical protein